MRITSRYCGSPTRTEYEDHTPIYEPNPTPSDQYKKAVAILKAKMKPNLDGSWELPLSMWLDRFRAPLKEIGFEIRINEKSLQREPAMKVTDERPLARVQALPDATVETVISEVLWNIGLTWIVHPDQIEILKIVDAKHKPVETETAGVAVGRTTEVGRYAAEFPHPRGLCDMHGNVWQWCENWFDQEHTKRVLRGGSWKSSPADCRAAHRIGADPERCENDCGFRVCFRLD
jgi:hypothetical protein